MPEKRSYRRSIQRFYIIFELKPSNITEDLYTRYRENQVQSALDDILELYQETVADLGLFKYEYQNKMLEIKATDDLQSSRLNSIESLDKTQNERLNKIEALNELQSTHLTQHDEALSKQASDLSSTADAIRQEESKRAEEQQKVDDAQTAALNKALKDQAAIDKKQDDDFIAYQTSQQEKQDKYEKAQKEIDSKQDAAIKKAEEWQDENWKDENGKELSLQEYISKMVAKEINDISAVNSAISTTEKTLIDRLDIAEKALSVTQEKNAQLENLLRTYAKTSSQLTMFSLFMLGSNNGTFTGSPNLDETFNFLNGSSATLDFTAEDDPNWRAPAYSELLFNDVVVSSDRTYTGTVNSNLTVQHRNTLTERLSPLKTIRFVEPVEPDKNPTDLRWVYKPEPVAPTVLRWRDHLTALTAAATSQNSSLYSWTSQQTVEYSSASKGWTPVTSYNLPEMFGSDSQITLRLKYTVYDIIQNSKDFIINLGTLNVTDVRRDAKYRISNITTDSSNLSVIHKQTPSASSLSAAFTNSSFDLLLDLGITTSTIRATFINEYTIQLSTGDVCQRVTVLPGGEYKFKTPSNEYIIVTIEETPAIWYTVD